MTASVWNQFVALVKKNLLLKRRRVRQTVSEAIYVRPETCCFLFVTFECVLFQPIYIIGILILVKVLNTHPAEYAAETFAPVPLIHADRSNASFAIPNGVLAFVDSSGDGAAWGANVSDVMTDALHILQSQNEIVGLFNSSSLRLRECANQTALSDLYSNASFLQFFAAVEFLPERRVAIRFNQTIIPDTQLALAPLAAALQCRTNTSSCTSRVYIESGFVALQVALTSALAPSLQSLVNITATQFPVDHLHDASAPAFLRVALGIYFVMAFTPVVQYLAVNVVGEKQRKIQVHLQTVGMTSSAHFGSWLAVYVVIVTLSVTVVTILSSVFDLISVSPVVLFFLLWSYAVSLLAFGFVVSSVMNADKAAGLVASLGSLLLSLPQFALPYIPFGAQYVVALSSPAALSMTLSKAVADNGFSAFFSATEWTAGSGIVMMLVDTVLYFLLALYLDAVWPYRDFGVPRHPLFCVGGSARRVAHDRDMQSMGGGAGDGTDARDFEALQYSAADVAVSLDDVHKHYGEKRAVRGVTLDLLKGEIYGLLGQNAAGKTSLISVMTGVLPATHGSVTIFGVDIATNPTAARSALGVCAQSDILFDELSVIEHMRLFAAIKGVPKGEAEAHVDALLHDVGLAGEHAKHAKDLSGGMKRKLSLAMALVGHPKLLVLDEVTAAMDPFSRQQVWKLLRRDAATRVTLMSTHFMDEADQVCDRKAIMRNGRFVVAGTSMFLKARFGLGYALTLGTDSARHAAETREWLARELPGGNAAEVKVEKFNVFVQLPPSESAAFPAFFRKLSAAKQTLGVADIDLNLPTLESVFLKLQNDADEHDKAIADEKKTVAAREPSSVRDERDHLLSERASVVPRTTPSFVQQLGGLFVARTQLKMREPKFYIFSVILPVAFMILGTVLGGLNASSSSASAPTPLDFAAHIDGVAAAAAHPAFGVLHGSAPAFVAKLPTLLPRNVSLPVATGNASAIDEWLLLRADNSSETVLGVLGDSAGAALAVWHNASLPSTLPGLLQATLLAAASEAVNVSVVSLPLPGGTLSFDTSSFLGVMFLSMGLTFTIGSYAIDPIRDRASGTKHLMTLMGLKRAAYWLAFLVSDAMTYGLIAVAAVIMVHAVPMKAFTGAALPAVLVLLALFIPTAILFAYTLSFLFGTNVDAAVSTLPPIINIVGVIAFIAVAITDMTGASNAAEIAHYVLSFALPPYALSGGLYFVVRVSLLSAVGALTGTTVTASLFFEWDRLVAVSMVAMVAHMCFFVLLIAVLDRWSDRAKRSVVSGTIKYDDASERDVDVDVAAEAERVRKLLADGVHRDDAPPLIVSGVSKAFRLPQQSDAKKKANAAAAAHDDNDRDVERNVGAEPAAAADDEIARRRKSAAVREGTVGSFTRVRTAVDNVSFATEEGSVMGLLGANGAGKTTLLSALIGDLAADSGEAFLVGRKVGANDSKCFESVGFCPQKDALFELLSVEQHLRLYARLKGLPAPLIGPRIQYLLDMMQIGEFRHVVAKKLSGGTKRKLSLAIALVAGPRVVFLDEPSAGVDVSAKRFLWNVIRANASHQAIVLTTHSLEEAEALSDRVMIMVNGGVQCIGSPAHLRQRFGRGLQVEVKSAVATVAAVAAAVAERFGECELVSSFFGAQRFRVRDAVELDRAFEIVDALQRDAALRVEFVTVSPTTLEQVFIEFAKLQLEELRV
jgi:ATP-binding cassette subfamily A (ABC1) protein 3